MRSLLLKSLTYVVLDLETTGLYADSGDEIVEIGAVLVEKGQLISSFHTMVHPGRPIPSSATTVTGIRDKDVATAPKIDQIFPGFCSFLAHHILVAQNAKFDMSFIFKNLKRLKLPLKQNIVIDTMAVSKLLFPYEQSHSLDAIMSRLEISRSGERHRSMDDTKYTAQAFIQFIELLEQQGKTSLPDLESAFISLDTFIKAEKPKTRNLFR